MGGLLIYGGNVFSPMARLKFFSQSLWCFSENLWNNNNKIARQVIKKLLLGAQQGVYWTTSNLSPVVSNSRIEFPQEPDFLWVSYHQYFIILRSQGCMEIRIENLKLLEKCLMCCQQNYPTLLVSFIIFVHAHGKEHAFGDEFEQTQTKKDS